MRTIKQRRGLSTVGPYAWNSLPSELRSLPWDLSSSFCKLLNPLNPTGRYSGLFYRCIYPKGRYSSLAIYRHNPTGLYSGQMTKTSYGEILRVECFNGYCMVVYLYIYTALDAVHTNQKRFQCKRPREKRAILRERKEALGVEGRSWFV